MKNFGDNSNAAGEAAEETEELFARARSPLIRYLRHHLDDASAAEDIAQESYIRFYQARSNGEEIGNPKAWLFRVAHNLLVDFGRKKRPDLLDEDGWLRVEGRLQRSTGGIEARVEIASLPWHKLTAAEMECLRLRSEGLKFREVAEVLDLSISTVASYVARAVKKLKDTDSDRESPKHGRTAATR